MHEDPFSKVLEIAKIENMGRQQHKEYKKSLEQMWAENGIREAALEDGYNEGRNEEKDLAENKS